MYTILEHTINALRPCPQALNPKGTGSVGCCLPSASPALFQVIWTRGHQLETSASPETYTYGGREASGCLPALRQLAPFPGAALLGGPAHQLRVISLAVPHVRIPVLLRVRGQRGQLAAPLGCAVRQQAVLPRLKPFRGGLLRDARRARSGHRLWSLIA